jgi:hypothetical protein
VAVVHKRRALTSIVTLTNQAEVLPDKDLLKLFPPTRLCLGGNPLFPPTDHWRYFVYLRVSSSYTWRVSLRDAHSYEDRVVSAPVMSSSMDFASFGSSWSYGVKLAPSTGQSPDVNGQIKPSHQYVAFLMSYLISEPYGIPGCLARKTTACHAHCRRSNSSSVYRILLDCIHSSFCLRFVPSKELECSKPFESSYCHISRRYARFGETCHKGRRVSCLLYSFKLTGFDYHPGMSCMWGNSGRHSQRLRQLKSITFREMRT